MTVQINGTTGITTPGITATGAPCFSAYQSIAQTVAGSTLTKINFQTKEFDTTNAFDNVTNMRFQPLVAGYYQVSCAYSLSTTVTNAVIGIFKNGTAARQSTDPTNAAAQNLTSIVVLNGSTDYVEIYCTITAGQPLSAGISYTYFQAALIRGL